MCAVAEKRASTEIIQLIPFNSSRKCMGAVIRLSSNNYRFVVKGAAKLMLTKTTHIVSQFHHESFKERLFSEEFKEEISVTINAYAERFLRTIGFLYKDFSYWPPADTKRLDKDKNMADFDGIFHDMIWIGVVGIQDPLRPQVTDAVRACQTAGIKVRMVTNRTTAQAIAIECGITTPHGIVIKGPTFRQLSDEEMDRVIPNLDILARSFPEDKRILVQHLKRLGETVAATGDGTNDGPAWMTISRASSRRSCGAAASTTP